MRLILTTFFFALISFQMHGQVLDPVHWKYSVKHVEGQTYDLIFEAKMDEGWTIYSQFIEEGGPVPTEFSFEEGAHYSIVGKVKESDNVKKGFDKVFEMQVAKFYEKATFTQRVKVTDPSKPITGFFAYMTCDHERCLPPKYVDFSLDIPASSSSAADGKQKDNTGAQSASAEKEKPVKNVQEESKVTDVPEDQSTGETEVQSGSALDQLSLGQAGGFDQSNLKEPVKWSFTHRKVDENTYELVATIDLEKGWHVYTQHIPTDKIGPVPTSFRFKESDQYELIGEVEEGGAKRIDGYDKFFEMDLVKFKEQATFSQKVRVKGQPKIAGDLEFMACNEEFCLPPKYVDFEHDLSREPGYVSGPVVANADPTTIQATINGEVIDQQIPTIVTTYKEPLGDCAASGEQTAKGQSLWLTFVLGFLGGLVALLTPCVFPMIPLTVSYFSKDTKRKGWVNGSFYGISIIVIYVAIGLIITGVFGATALNELSTNWIANTLFFLIFVVFALSFFGYYEITLPSSWTNKSDRMADKGGWVGIFFMAFTLALVSFSCTGPIIGSALVESATNKLGPFVVMLGFSTALALPFGLFAAFPAWLNSLPRSGSWMNSVKVILGFLELALAFKFLSVADMTSHWNFLRYELFLGIWVIIAIAMAAYLFGWIKFPHDSPMKKLSVPRLGLALTMSAIAVYLCTGFLPNERTETYNSLAALSGLAPPAHYNYFRPVPDVNAEIKAKYPSYSKCANNLDCFHDYYEGVAYAQEVNKPVFLDFTGYGCVNCRKTEEHIWIRDEVWERLKNDFVMVSLYVDDREAIDPVLVSSHTQEKLRNVGLKWADFQIVNFAQNTQPLYVVMTPQAEVLTAPRGYHPDVNEYVDFLECGLNAFERTGSLMGTQE